MAPKSRIQRESANAKWWKEKGRPAWSERRAYIVLAAEYAGYRNDYEEVDHGFSVSELSSRSEEELDYFIAHGTWPEDETPPA